MRIHAAEFEEREELSVFPYPFGFVDDRSSGLQLDSDCDQDNQPRKDDDQYQRSDHITYPFEDDRPSVKLRMLVFQCYDIIDILRCIDDVFQEESFADMIKSGIRESDLLKYALQCFFLKTSYGYHHKISFHIYFHLLEID